METPALIPRPERTLTAIERLADQFRNFFADRQPDLVPFRVRDREIGGMNAGIDLELLRLALEQERVEAVHGVEGVEELHILADTVEQFLRGIAFRDLEREFAVESAVAEIHRFTTVIGVLHVVREIDDGVYEDRTRVGRQARLIAFQDHRFVQQVVREQLSDGIVGVDRFADRVAIQRDGAPGLDHIAELRTVHVPLPDLFASRLRVFCA